MIVRKKLNIIFDDSEWRFFRNLTDKVEEMAKEFTDNPYCQQEMMSVLESLKTLSDYIDVE